MANLLDELAWPAAIRCRPAHTNDEAFLRQLHACTRSQDLALAGLDAALRDQLVQMQFEAQRRHYTQHHAGGQAWVIEHHAEPVGQMWLHLNDQGLRLMDIAVLPAHRQQGVASGCLQALMQRADAHGLAMHLHVRSDNPVRDWYARLGFVVTETQGLHQAMTRFALHPESSYEQA